MKTSSYVIVFRYVGTDQPSLVDSPSSPRDTLLANITICVKQPSNFFIVLCIFVDIYTSLVIY